MRPMEAMKLLLEGKKLRYKHFKDGEYLHLSEGNVVRVIAGGDNFVDTYFEDCEVYEEPKKKVKAYKYIYKSRSEEGFPHWVESASYFDTESRFRALYYLNKDIPVQRLDHTMIEVEE